MVLTSYTPRICGIATYSKDLEDAFNKKFGNSLAIFICPLEARYDNNSYPAGMHPLKTNCKEAFLNAAHAINSEPNIKIVLIQHEFGLFKENENAFFEFLKVLHKPVVLTFHTVLPNPDIALLHKVKLIASLSDTLVVMTDRSSKILRDEYQVPAEKINVIPHGTHLVPYVDKVQLKKKYGLSGKNVLTNFGLLGPGKSIETTLDALPGIVSNFPNTIFLILGKTHPAILREEGELYRRHSTEDWQWFEDYLTYGNSALSQALLMAYLLTANNTYKEVAKNSMDFLLSQIFIGNSIRVISNKSWFKKGHELLNEFQGGEQPIDVSYTILALRMFDQVFPDHGYFEKMEGAFNWFLGGNPLHHIIYNPSTGGCYDGLERNNVNLNQGAESTVSYLLARLAFEEYDQETISFPKRINIQGSPISRGLGTH